MGHLYRLNKYHNCAVGSHTAVRVAGEISKVFREYSIENKVHYAVTDNASNMKAAFNVSFNLSDDTSSDDVNSEDTLNRSEEHTSELQSPVPISYAVFCLKKKKQI